MNTRPKAYGLADALEALKHLFIALSLKHEAAAELRRLHEENQELRDALGKEREACAKICDQAAANYFPEMREAASAAKHCATVIRARAGDTA